MHFCGLLPQYNHWEAEPRVLHSHAEHRNELEYFIKKILPLSLQERGWGEVTMYCTQARTAIVPLVLKCALCVTQA
jgi:hypothetical protein